jgi:type II secretion system protein N
MTRSRILALLGYNTFFWVVFWLCAYWSFPYERLAAFLVDKVAESGSGYTLEIGGLAPYWLSGVELEDVQVRKQASAALATPPSDDAKGAPVDPAIKIQSARARVGLLSLLTGSRDVSFFAQLGTGAVEGTYEEDAEAKTLVAKLSKVDLAKLGLLESIVPLPMKGTLTGDFDLTLGAQPSKTAGSIKLAVQQLTMGDGKAKLKLGAMGGLTIDPISAGALNVEIDVKDGVGTIRKLSTNGSDLKLDGSGSVRFVQPLARSRLDLTLKIALTDAYKNKSARTQAMFTLLETSGSPQVAAAKAADGSYQLRLLGTFASVRPLPSGQLGAPATLNIPLPTEGDDPGEGLE